MDFNFHKGVWSVKDKKQLLSWLEAAQMQRYDDEDLMYAIDRLKREITYFEKTVPRCEPKPYTPKMLDWDKFGETIQWAIDNKFHFEDEALSYGKFDEYQNDPKFDKEKLNELLNFFIDKTHSHMEIDKEFYNDNIDEWTLTEKESAFFFPCERFIFVSRAPGEDVDTFFDYYEISGQGTAFCLDIHRADETDYVDERMKEYFIRTYDRFEEKLIKC